MIPTSSNYPADFDTNVNLYEVHDELRVTLTEDYNPGDTKIKIYDENDKMKYFPTTGIITLTEQSSDIDKRAITFFYDNREIIASGAWNGDTFEKLEKYPEFEDVVKPKDITNVTINVVADHHNNIKNAVIAMEDFIGIKGTIDLRPFGATLEGRVNFLTKLVLTPRAWFTADKKLGLIPLSINFTDQSFRLGKGEVIYTWDFGDSTSLVSTVSVTSTTVPMSITKTYNDPGKYSVRLTVQNQYGQDQVLFEDLINARTVAPNEAYMEIVPKTGQLPIAGDSTLLFGIRSPIGLPIEIDIPDGVFSTDSSHVYSNRGEPLKNVIYFGGNPISGTPIDPIQTYTWSLGDDLSHPSAPYTKALYSVGGLYDIILRTDTYLGAYRITTHQEVIDIVESRNLWLWVFESSVIGADTTASWDLQLVGPGTTANVNAYEFGLLSETFKVAGVSQTITRDDHFLDNYTGSITSDAKKRAKKEFRRNTGFAPRGTTFSGNNGDALLYWASGGILGSSYGSQVIKMTKFNGFQDLYTNPDNVVPDSIYHPWNWICLSNSSKSYFLFGGGDPSTTAVNTNPTYQIKHAYDFYANPAVTATTLTVDNYKNGATELMQNPSTYSGGVAVDGYFSTYRTCWKGSAGYILRNSGTGWAFRLQNFYKTEGPLSEQVTNVTKLADMAGSAKTEGQLVPLANGIFFFNNSGNISAFDDVAGVWQVGGPSQSSVAFSSLQDTNAENFSLQDNTLLAGSDSNYTAYLSYDYSNNAFIKFNSQDATFTTAGSRPIGYQFMLGVY